MDLFYYSGHRDIESLILYDGFYDYSNLDEIFDLIDCSQKIILIDACKSSSIRHRFSDDNYHTYIMTVCKDTQSALETYQTWGLFTYFLLTSFSMENDENSDGALSLEEQYPYIRTKVEIIADGYGVEQEPIEIDWNTGPTIFMPSVSNLSFSYKQKNMYYSFKLHGSGEIYACNLTMDYDNNETVYDLVDFTNSENGFGIYNGSIKLNSKPKEMNFQLKVLVQGERLRWYTYSFTLSIPSPNKIFFSNWHLFFLLIGIIILAIFSKKKMNRI